MSFQDATARSADLVRTSRVPRAGFWTDESWRTSCRECPLLDRINAYLPPRASRSPVRRYVRKLASSYREHQYDLFFYGLARALRPRCCVEAGVLEGFSLIATAAALRDNGGGHLTAYDLFERYPYRHAEWSRVAAACHDADLQAYVTLRQADVNEAPPRHTEVDLLHVDISNDGETYREQFARWSTKVTGAIVFEGGSRRRDEVWWMKTYDRAPTSDAVEALRARHPNWYFSVLEPYPSMTVAVRLA
jgi:hypothetical protein